MYSRYRAFREPRIKVARIRSSRDGVSRNARSYPVRATFPNCVAISPCVFHVRLDNMRMSP